MKLRKLLLTVFAVLFIGWGSALSQDDNGEKESGESNANNPFSIENLNNPGIEHGTALKEFGLRYLLQQNGESSPEDPGSGNNVALIKQVGNNNVAELNQDGNNNYGYIQQDGDFNKAFVDQKGNRLISVVNMQGSNNYLDFLQDTNNRGAYFQFDGSNMRFNAQQDGAGFRMWQENSTMPAIKIETTRKTLPVIISN